jgi:RNA polymerase sigma factor (sigma-70 family)
MPNPALPAVIDHIRRLTRAPAGEDLTDRQLLQRFAAGHDEVAFAALVRRHGRLVLGVCRRVLRQEQDAEDAFQATFLVLARKAGSVRWQESVGGWLHKVARRVARDARERAGRRLARERSVAELPDVAAPQDGAARELGALLDEELLRLPECHRTPLLLCYLEGASREQAAGRLGLPLRTLERRLHQGREALRSRLARRGITLTAALLGVALADPVGGRAAALAAATARAAAGFAARQAGAASVRAVALAEALLGAAVPLKLRAAGLALLLLGIAGLGAGFFRPAPAEPPAAEPAPAPAAAGKRSPHADVQGDPLPPGAVNRFGTTRLRHGGPVGAVAFSPDGKLAACGANWSDDDIRLWDTATGREVRALAGHGDALRALAFTPDGKRLVSSSNDGTARVWDVPTGQELHKLLGHQGQVRDVAVAPDGKTAVTAGADGTARLWDLGAGKELLQLRGHDGSVEAVALSPDGKTVATAGADKTVRLWESATGKEVRSLEAHEAGATAVAFSADGKTLATGGKGGDVRLWGATTGTSLRGFQAAQRPVGGLALSPDGKVLACVPQGEPPSLWDPATGTRKDWSVSWTGGEYGRVAFAPDGKTVLFGSGDNSAHLLDIATLKELAPGDGHRGFVDPLSFTADGKGLMTVGFDLTARLWDRPTGAVLRQFPVRHSPSKEACASSPDGATLACGDVDGVIRLYERASGRERRALGSHDGPIWALAYSPDGKVLASGGNDHTVRLWDAADGTPLQTLRGHEGLIRYLAFSPDGHTLASGSADHTARLWDVATGKERYVLKGHQAELESVSFSPDGALLATSAREAPIRVWDVAAGKELYQLKGHTSWVYLVAFSPDGRTLASGSLDNTVCLWEVQARAERARFVGHRGGVPGLAFSADGRTLASGSADGTALLWDITGRAADGRLAAANLTPPALEAAWADLGTADATRAHRAIWELVAGPAQALPLLRAELHPVAAVPEDTLRRLIARLDDDDYAAREAATAELAGLGDVAEPALRKAQQGRTSAEQRQRLAYLLEKLGDQAPSPGRLRDPRALEVLEQIGTKEARDVLAALAKGAPSARLTRDARAALERLERRKAPPS